MILRTGNCLAAGSTNAPRIQAPFSRPCQFEGNYISIKCKRNPRGRGSIDFSLCVRPKGRRWPSNGTDKFRAGGTQTKVYARHHDASPSTLLSYLFRHGVMRTTCRHEKTFATLQ